MSPKGYGDRIDAVVYQSDATSDFKREDWLRLALAALDQAGVRPEDLADAAHGRTDDEIVFELGLD